MSYDDATWTLLLHHIPSARNLHAWLESAETFGLRISVPVVVTSATGEGVLHFGSVDGAIDYIRENGGLIPLIGARDHDAVFLSIHLRHGVLAQELGVTNETPCYDEIRLDIDARARSLGGAGWLAFKAGVSRLGIEFGVFAWCAMESSFEEIAPVQIHQLVSRGRVPEMQPLAASAPATSGLAADLRRRARSMSLMLWTRCDAWDEYRTTDDFWELR